MRPARGEWPESLATDHQDTSGSAGGNIGNGRVARTDDTGVDLIQIDMQMIDDNR
jgi:hypothetical protein